MPRRKARQCVKYFDWEGILSEFLLFKKVDGCAERTLKDYRVHVTQFFSRFPDAERSYEEMQRCLLAYLAEPVAPATRNLRLTYLKAFLKWCVRKEYLPDNPLAEIKKVRDEGNIRHISLEDVTKLLKQPNKRTYVGLRDYCIMLLQLDTAIRPGELVRLLPEDVNLESGEVYVRPGIAKTRRKRMLPLSSLTIQALEQFLKIRPQWWGPETPLFATEYGSPMNSFWWAKRFKEYSVKAGVTATPYSMRHTAAIEFLRNGADAFTLQRILGHTDISMTKRYVKLTQDDIKEVHARTSPVQRLLRKQKRASRNLGNNVDL